MAGPAGIEPACAGLQPAANPSQLETHVPTASTTRKSGPPESNRVSPESESGRLPSSSIPKRGPPRTRTAHLLLARQALLPDELAAHCRRDIAATAHSAGMTTCRIWC